MDYYLLKKRAKSTGLCILSLVLVLISWFSLGFTVRVGDWATPQPLSALQTEQCFNAAYAAAAELGSGLLGLEAEIKPRLMFGKRGGGESELARRLLLSAEDVKELWAVYAGGGLVGYAVEPSELYEMMEASLHSRSGSDVAAASFTARVDVRARYVPETTEADVDAAIAAIKEGGVRIITA